MKFYHNSTYLKPFVYIRDGRNYLMGFDGTNWAAYFEDGDIFVHEHDDYNDLIDEGVWKETEWPEDWEKH